MLSPMMTRHWMCSLSLSQSLSLSISLFPCLPLLLPLSSHHISFSLYVFLSLFLSLSLSLVYPSSCTRLSNCCLVCHSLKRFRMISVQHSLVVMVSYSILLCSYSGQKNMTGIEETCKAYLCCLDCLSLPHLFHCY